MGIYDRDYQRDYYGRAPGFHLGSSLTLTSKLVIVMFAVYVVQLLTRQGHNDGWFTDLFCLQADLPKHAWRFFNLLTYGFLHAPNDVRHIAFNMLALWFFGRSVEYRYGPREYLTFFLVAIVAAGAIWVVGEFVVNRQWLPIPMLGASGGISAVLLLFCLNFPHQVIYIYGVIPIPAWVFALIFVTQDMFGAWGRPIGSGERDINVAYTAHLGGAAFALLYYQLGWRLELLLPSGKFLDTLKPKPRLRVVDPDSADDSDDDADESREAQVDAILQKIQEHGRDSLTRSERRILEEASREYQRRRK